MTEEAGESDVDVLLNSRFHVFLQHMENDSPDHGVDDHQQGNDTRCRKLHLLGLTKVLYIGVRTYTVHQQCAEYGHNNIMFIWCTAEQARQ